MKHDLFCRGLIRRRYCSNEIWWILVTVISLQLGDVYHLLNISELNNVDNDIVVDSFYDLHRPMQSRCEFMSRASYRNKAVIPGFKKRIFNSIVKVNVGVGVVGFFLTLWITLQDYSKQNGDHTPFYWRKQVRLFQRDPSGHHFPVVKLVSINEEVCNVSSAAAF